MPELRRFQREFLRRALSPDVDISALSVPRGNGKSWLAGHVLARCLTPGDSLYQPGAEYLLLAGSLDQARMVFRFVRDALEPTGRYRFRDSSMQLGVVGPENTRLKVISSNAKTAFGIVGCPLLVADEPGAWETRGGELMADAIMTAIGKPESPLKVLMIGTLAPALSGWWHDLIADGSRDRVHVTSLQGDPARWDSWPEIRRCNPLTAVSADFRRRLLAERNEARADTRLKARFLSYRLNLPTADESQVLLTVDDWRLATARDVPERQGKPIVGVDLGGGRAWSAAVAIYPSGRIEAMAYAPGIPDLAEQEKRDRVPSGTYRRLREAGRLAMADNLRVQPVELFVEAIRTRWGQPACIWCDRFRLAELQDHARGMNVQPRVTRWSEASADIRALRRLAKDGPLSVDPGSRDLIEASLSVARVQNDDQGSVRLVKNGSHNTARDDVAAALTLAAGAWERATRRPKATFRVALAG